MKKLLILCLFISFASTISEAQTLTQSQIYRSQEFDDGVQFAMVTIARNVYNEAANAHSAAVTEKRQALVQTIFTAPFGQVKDRFKALVISGYFGTTQPTKGDLEYLVSQVWNEAAGITKQD